MRILIAGVLGAIAMFIWATVAHTLTPLAGTGLKALPNEAAMTATLQQNLGDRRGLYFFPFAPGSDAKAMAAQEAKMKTAPSGLLVYNPPGTPGLTTRQLVAEFIFELCESLITALLLTLAVGFLPRLGVASLVGVVAAMATNFSYWNWYGFSLDYTLAAAFMELMKFVVAGAVIALILGWRRGAKA